MAEGRGNGRAEGGATGLKPGTLTALLEELAAAPRPKGGAWEAVLRAGASVGRFELVRELGRGGFGVVWEARDKDLGRGVALKAVWSGAEAGPLEERLPQEAEAAARLSHPNIVTLYDAGRAGPGPYLVLELLRGETLEQRLARGQPSLREVLRVMAEVARGMAHAHAQGVAHRDLKPANVFLCQDGQVKVLDLGLAHAFGRRRIDGGTPAYMAPEQWRGAPEDERADVFAMGLILFRMVAGTLPFPNAPDWARSSHQAPPLEAPEAPGLGALVARMLAKDPVDRPRDADAVLGALEGLRRGLEAAAPPAGPRPGPSPRRSRWVIALALAAAGLGAGAAGWLARREARLRRALQELPRVVELAEKERYAEAFALAERVEAVVPGDPRLAALWPRVSSLFDVRTIPEGAEVSVREYAATEGAWRRLGQSPVTGVRLPVGLYRWKIEKEGFSAVEWARGRLRAFGDAQVPLAVRLDRAGTIPPEMVHVPGGVAPIQLVGLEHLPPVRLGDYLLDRTEVTNREFKRFVDAGGYRNPRLWRQPVLKDGRTLPWAEAMALFRDRTGRPGPATWESGDYPEGRGDLPVTGVSWYEAAAFAAFAGKELPTVYHWSRAAGAGMSAALVPGSNFGGKRLAPVGSYPGIGLFGTYDMAGNAKEWCWNAAGDERYILGGAWDEPSYAFNDPDAQPPLARRGNYGFRLAKALEGDTAQSAWAPIPLLRRDYARERPVERRIAQAYARAYGYDKGPLDAKVEHVDDSADRWRQEKVSYAAAYGGERMPAHLFTPRNVVPPYQTVVVFPGSNAIYQRSSEKLDYLWLLAPILKSGRAVMVPVYKSTYERGDGLASYLPERTAAYRAHVAMWTSDLGRSIDYVESRPDLDGRRVALYGLSWGAMLAPIFLAVEGRIRAGILVGGGLVRQRAPPEADPFNFAPLVTQPTLMLNGTHDFYFPVESGQAPLFRRLGSPEKDKRHVIVESGHMPPNEVLSKEMLDWLDRYLGTVR